MSTCRTESEGREIKGERMMGKIVRAAESLEEEGMASMWSGRGDEVEKGRVSRGSKSSLNDGRQRKGSTFSVDVGEKVCM